MTKTTETTYFAPISFGPGGCWGSGTTPEAALQKVCKEAIDFARGMGGFKPGAKLDVNVYEIPAGHYAYQDERGIFVVDHDTDEIKAYAAVSHRFTDVYPRKPAIAQTGKPEDAYHDGGAALAAANRERKAPIGSKVAA
jgi:hypothetical protein